MMKSKFSSIAEKQRNAVNDDEVDHNDVEVESEHLHQFDNIRFVK
jgi:hypothetical protein